MEKVYGYINSIETMGLVDGPGIRFVVFLQGCELRCLYCHNVETWDKLTKSFKITPKTLLKKILKYKNYYGAEGGVTFSGGEPLLQPKFLLECLKLCKQNNINTALDTAGVGVGYYDEILKYVDLVILDIKATEEQLYKKITGKSMKKFNDFLKAVQKNNNDLWLRQVIVPNLNDSKENVIKLKEYAKKIKNVKKIELLPYKTMGAYKYKILNIPYRLEGVQEMSEQKIEELSKFLI